MTACLWSVVLSTSLGQAPVLPAPTPLAAPAPIVMTGPIVLDKPISHYDFARMFQPAPGNYEICFIHPVKCCPVKVCFCLPPGCPKVCVGKRSLCFDYGNCEVTIQFKILFGRARVYYD
ncbi:MAG: hypothetical protein AB7K24_00460 [Gemmataceae bacterium]